MTSIKPEELEKLVHYAEGQADESEKAWVESLFINGEDNSSLRKVLEKDWNSIVRDSGSSGIDLTLLLDRIHHLIRIRDSRKRSSFFWRLVRIYMKAAAILLLPLLVAGGLIYNYLGNKNKTAPDQMVSSSIFAPMGSRVSFNLPDGTLGMLNSGSKLTYSLPFNNNRQIHLDGEAWFDVSKDENHPFEINIGSSKLAVLGTCFNVMAYPAESYIEVVLQKGKIEFFDKESSETVIMMPSERLVLRSGKISKTVTDPAKYLAWTKGRMVFNNDPMAEVARRIERWYNVEIRLADKELEKYSFRGTFEDDSLEEVMQFLSMTSPIKYKITPRKMRPDGTYEKERVTIYLKKTK